MRRRTLLILSAVVAVLAAFIWFVERDLPSSQERAEQAKRILRLEEDAVDNLKIEWDDRVVELHRVRRPATVEEAADTSAQSDWHLALPMAARADGTAVSSLVSQLVDLQKERTLEQVTRADVGLADPRARVTLTSTQGAEVLEIGAEIPASSNMMVRVEGRDDVYVVANSIWSTLTKEPGDWRDKELFPGSRVDVDRLILSNGDRRVLLARRDEAFWIESPLVDRAEEEAVATLLTEITGLRAESFVDQPAVGESEMGLDYPLGSLEVVVRGQEQAFRLDLGAPLTVETAATPESPARYARLGEQIILLKADLAESLERTVRDWRSLDWAASEVYRIERALIEDAGGEVEVRREDGDWWRDGQKVGYAPATDLLSEITGARAVGLIDDAPPLGEPELIVTMESDDGTREIVELFAPRKDGVPARVSERQAVLLLPADVASDVRARVADLRAAEVESTAPEDAAIGSDG